MSQVWKHIYPGLNHLMFCIVHFPILSRFGRSCIYEGTNKSMLLNAQSPFVCICLLLHTKTVFSLPGVPLTNPSLSLIQKTRSFKSLETNLRHLRNPQHRPRPQLQRVRLCPRNIPTRRPPHPGSRRHPDANQSIRRRRPYTG